MNDTPERGEVSAQIRTLLKSYFWIEGLEPGTRYSRIHDDHDGTHIGQIAICMGDDGDAWVEITGDPLASLRFRMPLVGGGASPHTRTALLILAEAIRLDNEAHPQRWAGANNLQATPEDKELARG
jgi:hypothetical protein